MKCRHAYMRTCFLFLNIIFLSRLDAQEKQMPFPVQSDTSVKRITNPFNKQLDLIDLTFLVFHKDPKSRLDSSGNQNTNIYFTVAPVVEFTIATQFSLGIAGNLAFMTSVKKKTNTSSFLGAVKYTEKKQFMLPIQSSIWTAGNEYNLIGDWRYFNYPQDTYGLGGYTTAADKFIINYKYIRIDEHILRNYRRNFYAGIGYQLDNHWNIAQLNVAPGRITDYVKYDNSTSSISSGLSLELLYDSRENSINPNPGSWYAHVQYTQYNRSLGSTVNWNTVMLDIRKYIQLPMHMTLAFWCYTVFTLKGNPPYLDLPGTGCDMFNNTGRGYEQGRYTGKNYADLEVELRFKVTRNGLLGAVIFGNASSVSEFGTGKMEVITPAIGAGLRIKFNKFSLTNACIDYGAGIKGSNGFSGNLGEVF